MHLVLVEDEAMVARRLERFLRDLVGDRLHSLHRLDGVEQALDHVQRHPVDLLFLDLHLHGEDGFQILRRLVARPFHTIVVSAYGERALEAFELGVLDFVPKPFTRDRLAQALARLETKGTAAQELRYLAVRRRQGMQLVNVDSVVLLKGAGDYSEIHTREGEVLLHEKSLQRLETLLPSTFLRVHRSWLVDLRQAEQLSHGAGGRHTLHLKDGREIPVGRTRLAALREHWL